MDLSYPGLLLSVYFLMCNQLDHISGLKSKVVPRYLYNVNGIPMCHDREKCSNHGCWSSHLNTCFPCDFGWSGSHCEKWGGSSCHDREKCNNRGCWSSHLNSCFQCDIGWSGSRCDQVGLHSHSTGFGLCHDMQNCNNNGCWSTLHSTCHCFHEWSGNLCEEKTLTTTTQLLAKETPTTTTAAAAAATTTTTTAGSTKSTKTQSSTTPTYRPCAELSALVDLSSGKISTNAEASSCVTGDHAGSEAFVLNHCRVTSLSSWTKGYNVMNICNKLPMYRAIATFMSGTYVPGQDSSGIFLGCLGDKIRVGLQTCEGGISGLTIRNITMSGTGPENASLYYTVL